MVEEWEERIHVICSTGQFGGWDMTRDAQGRHLSGWLLHRVAVIL